MHSERVAFEARLASIGHASWKLGKSALALVEHVSMIVDSIPSPFTTNALKEMPVSHGLKTSRGIYSSGCKVHAGSGQAALERERERRYRHSGEFDGRHYPAQLAIPRRSPNLNNLAFRD